MNVKGSTELADDLRPEFRSPGRSCSVVLESKFS